MTVLNFEWGRVQTSASLADWAVHPSDDVWVVTDPTDTSDLADLYFRCELSDLARHFRAGRVRPEQHPAIYALCVDADADARKRWDRYVRWLKGEI